MNELHVNKRHTSGVSSELIFSNYRSAAILVSLHRYTLHRLYL